jgi:hypothetical protein
MRDDQGGDGRKDPDSGPERSPEVPQASPTEAAQQAKKAEGKPDREAREERRTSGEQVEAGAAGHGAEPRGKRSENGEATYLIAIAEALWEEMERDERVFLLGEDIGMYGGAFKVTEGFIDRFGPDRVMDTPIAEETIVGTSIGAAMEGLRPVAEFQYADFMTSGFDELVTTAGKYHYFRSCSADRPVAAFVRLPSTRTIPSRSSRTPRASRWSVRPSQPTPKAC